MAGFEKDGLWYEIINETEKHVSVRYANWNAKPIGELCIPEEVDTNGTKYIVTEIGMWGKRTESHYEKIADKRKKDGYRIETKYTHSYWYGFQSCEDLVSVSLPKSIVKIGRHSFEGCRKLRQIHLPEHLTEINEDAFSSCIELTTIQLPNTIRHIGIWAFAGCVKLKEINIPLGLQEISSFTFSGCHCLKTIKIPANVKIIKQHAFLVSKDDLPEGKYLHEAIIDNSDGNLVIESGAFPKETKIQYKKKGFFANLFNK